MKKLLLLFAFICTIFFAGEAKSPERQYGLAFVMAYSPTASVYEDDNIRCEIYGGNVWASNKTEQPIFLDVDRIFLIHNGATYPVTSSSTDGNSKAKVTSTDRFIVLAPQIGSEHKPNRLFQVDTKIYGKYTSTESPSKNFTVEEERLVNLVGEIIDESLAADPKGKQPLATVHRHLTEDESINKVGVSLSYAFSKETDSWTPIQINSWVSDVILCPYYVEMPEKLGDDEKRGFGAKKSDYATKVLKADSPFEFAMDNSPVIVCRWTGNYKKGEFTLNGTYVYRKGSFGDNYKLMQAILGGDYMTARELSSKLEIKSNVKFDGADTDWGTIKYSKGLFSL